MSNFILVGTIFSDFSLKSKQTEITSSKLKDELINFYEWTNTDKITKLNVPKIAIIENKPFNNLSLYIP